MSPAVLIYPPPTQSCFHRGTHLLCAHPLFLDLIHSHADCSQLSVAQFDGVHVVSGSLDTSIRVWDVESGACRHALMGHQVILTFTMMVTKMLTLLCPELDLWYGVARQHLGVGQRRLDSQDPGHPHRTVPSDSVRYTFDFSQT